MPRHKQNSGQRVARPEKGRALFYHRDSGGGHETTPGEFVRWAQTFCRQHELGFKGTPEQIDLMIKQELIYSDDMFLDWDIGGHKLSRPGLDAIVAAIRADTTVSHVIIPRPDRLARPKQVEEGMRLERIFRQELGVWLIFKNRSCRPLARGENMAVGEWLQAALDYDQAGRFRREHSEKMLLSQARLARDGFSTGGRAKYGLQRWLITTGGSPVRALADGDIP